MKKNKSQILEGTKNVVSSKFIDRNTLGVTYSDGSRAIRLHNTDVVTFKKDAVTLNSGGWRTATTKDRINRYSPCRVSQVNGIWYVAGAVFFDGITIKNGKPVKVKKINLAKIQKTKDKIKKFVSQITKENLPIPSSGDCWLCSLRTEDGKTMGECSHDNTTHIAQHLKENYLHGSLLVNAMRDYGYNDSQIGLHYQMKLTDTFRRATRRYLQKNLLEIAVR